MDEPTDKREFTIWASRYTTTQCMLIAIPVSAAIIAIITIYINTEFVSENIWRTVIYCGIVFSIIWYLRLLTTKKIIIVVDSNQIQVFHNQKLYYKSGIENLRYIVGADIDSEEYNTATTTFVFDDKKVVLSVADSRDSMSKSSKTLLELITYLKNKFQLEKKEQEEALFHDTCYYINTQQRPSTNKHR